jgi:hypothetical protein
VVLLVISLLKMAQGTGEVLSSIHEHKKAVLSKCVKKASFKAWGMGPVTWTLPSKLEALSSNPNIKNKKNSEFHSGLTYNAAGKSSMLINQ